MTMTTKINFLGYMPWLTGTEFSEKYAVLCWIITFQFDLSINICLRQTPKSIIGVLAVSLASRSNWKEGRRTEIIQLR